jgi:hypothetical protein
MDEGDTREVTILLLLVQVKKEKEKSAFMVKQPITRHLPEMMHSILPQSIGFVPAPPPAPASTCVFFAECRGIL